MLKIAWSPVYCHPLPVNHRFPMEKYNLLPQQLRYEGLVGDDNFFEPEPLSKELILRTHKASYWEKLDTLSLDRKEERKTGFPLSRKLIQREVIIAQGTVDCTQHALKYGISFNIAGGTHHAFADRGEGFCLLNDIAIAANYLLDQGQANQIMVIDLDVHQGNGTASLFQSEPRVFTFSMHGAKNYPMHKEQSDRDIPLEDGTGDPEYLSTLREQLEELIPRVNPDFVFYQSGVDVLATDKLGKLGLSIQGCRERDFLVLDACRRKDIPITAVMGGGYSQQISHIIEAHANTYRLADELYF